MNEQNNGGPAFPVAYGGGRIEGMTLRDYFAAKALSCLDIQAHVEAPAAEILALSAYHIADAMLKARG